jgi:tetratricopeptide (TPR) repeat protein
MMGMRGAGFLLVLASLALAGCGPKRVVINAPQPTAGGDELVRQGCYDCLLEARTEYERVSTRFSAAVVRLFETNLLLALREKELSVDSSSSLARAEALVSRLTNVPAERVLSIAKLLPSDGAARRLLPPTRQTREELESVLTAIESSTFSDPFKRYLTLSIQCGRLTPQPSVAASSDEVPLVAYRRATCDNFANVAALKAVRTSVPRFVESSFFLGRAAMASLFKTDGSQARQYFEEAFERFPTSPAIAYELGTLHQATNDCRSADTYFSRALELNATHEDARLGRTICRTYLSRHDDAIADATVLIDAEASNRGEAFYWRAWNRRHGGQLEPARADIERARALRYNARILTLAGMIEHDQRDFDNARRDLERAHEMDSRECEAPWYLALVEFSVEAWAPSAKGFAAAADCYDTLVNESQRLRAAMAASTDVTEEFRARQITGFDAAIATDSLQKSAAELNAAINYGRAGDLTNATVYMKRAAVDPQRRVAVEDLRQVLGVPRW